MKFLSILLSFLITISIFSNDSKIKSIIDKMTIEQKVGQLFNIAIVGKKLKPEYKEFLTKYSIGGVTLFNYNMRNRKQIKNFITSLQKIMDIPLFVSVDQEGGRINRYKHGYFLPPSPFMLGYLNDIEITKKVAKYVALDLKGVGINLNLAPVVDILTNRKNVAIFDRSYGTETNLVSKHSAIFIETLQNHGVIATAKHFPGQGDMAQDTHKALPHSKLTLKTLQKREFIPFKKSIEKDVGVVMTSHVIFNKIDKKYPVTLSKKFLKEILRDQLNYKNLIFTDGLEMKAVRDSFGLEKATILSLQNGADIVTLNWDIKHIQIAIDAVLKALKEGVLTEAQIDEKLFRILKIKDKYLNSSRKIIFNHKRANKELYEWYKKAQIFKNIDKKSIFTDKKIYTNLKTFRKLPNITYNKKLSKNIKNSVIILKSFKRVSKSLIKDNIIIFLGPKIDFDSYKNSKAWILHDYNYTTIGMVKNIF